MVRSHCIGPGLGVGPGTMGYHIRVLCRTVHTAPGPGTGVDPLSPIVPVPFPVPVSFPCSVNVPLHSHFPGFFPCSLKYLLCFQISIICTIILDFHTYVHIIHIISFLHSVISQYKSSLLVFVSGKIPWDLWNLRIMWNKKVLLRERKRHTDRGVSSTPSVIL